jgi:hypothetical protein
MSFSCNPSTVSAAVAHLILVRPRHMRHPSLAFTFSVASLLGLAAVVAPVWILRPRHYSAPLFPLVRTGVEGMSFLTLVFLFCSGIILGCFGRGSPFLLGITTVALLPVSAIAEMIVSPTSHNLWPLEFAIYGLVSLSAIVGAFLGRFVRRRVDHTKV